MKPVKLFSSNAFTSEKKRAKRRAKYLEVRDDVLESARASYKADQEKKRTEDLMAIGGVKSKETRSYQKGKCNSPIFSTETTHALEMCLI